MRTLSSILIANRGEIARRIIRSCKKLGKRTIAIYSEADRDALHVHEADEAYLVGPADANLSYLNIENILEIARRTQADAVHPGYGFLSESKTFAKQLLQSGVHFIGPSPFTLEILGEKDRARRLASEISVPVAKGAVLESLKEDYLKAQSESLTFPLLIKAVSGGGGRGMRIVRNFSELLNLAPAASREAEQFFGSGALILEECIAPARHIEIQLLADRYGNVVHLFERDCSAQRRNQKVIEESPARNMPSDLLDKLYAHAKELAQHGKLEGVATAEFLVRLDSNGIPDGRYIFLEVNPRIQVEHPVTEMVTGIDLVEQQIRVAEGQRLDFVQEDIKSVGHAVQARIYAEIPEKDFLPSAGKILGLKLPAEETCVLRVEHGLEDRGDVQTSYDSMLIKEIAWGKDFTSARDRLLQALGQTDTPGVANNIRFLSDLVQQTPFVEASMDVAYISNHPPAPVTAREAKEALLLSLRQEYGAGPRDLERPRFFRAGFLARNKGTLLALPFRSWKVESSNSDEVFQFEVRLAERENHDDFPSLRFEFRLDTGEIHSATVQEENRVEVPATQRRPLGAETRTISYQHQDWLLSPQSLSSQREDDGSTRIGAEVLSPLPGALVRVLAKEGESVEKGQSLFVLESMKTEHQILAPQSGRIEDLRFEEGAKVLARMFLCRIL